MSKIEEIHSLEAFHILRDDWNRLTDETPDTTIFQMYDYLDVWLETFAIQFPLRILVVRDGSDGKISAVMPFYEKKYFGVRRLHLLGDTHSDYSHIIAQTDVSLLADAVLERLGNDSAWDLIYFNSIIGDSRTALLVDELGRRGFSTLRKASTRAPKLAIPGSWDSFYAALDKKIRQDTERQRRRLAQIGETKLLEIESHQLEESLNTFFSVHRKRWREQDQVTLFDNARNREFYIRIARRFEESGLLRFSKLVVGDEIAAMHFGFAYNRRFYYYIPAYSPDYEKYSVGRILTLDLIKQSFDEGITCFDFMAGDEEYKYLFSNQEDTLIKAYVFNRNLKGRWLGFLKRAVMNY